MNEKTKREFKCILVTKGLNVSQLAEGIGVVPSTLYRKLKHPDQFTQGEITLIRKKLKLTDAQAHHIFFAK